MVNRGDSACFLSRCFFGSGFCVDALKWLKSALLAFESLESEPLESEPFESKPLKFGSLKFELFQFE